MTKGFHLTRIIIYFYTEFYCTWGKTMQQMLNNYMRSLNYLLDLLISFYVWVFLTPCMLAVCHMHAWCLQRSEETNRPLETLVIDGCKPPRGFLESNLDSLQEWQGILTTEASLLFFMSQFSNVKYLYETGNDTLSLSDVWLNILVVIST